MIMKTTHLGKFNYAPSFWTLESVADQERPSPMKDVFATGDNNQDNLI
jgi:hypothetical protein